MGAQCWKAIKKLKGITVKFLLNKSLIWKIIVGLTTLFLIVWIWFDYTLLVGWSVGIILSLINVKINHLFINYWLIKAHQASIHRSSKLNGWWKGFLKSQIFLVFFSAFFIGVLLFNKWINGFAWEQKSLKIAYYPINVFTLTLGLTIGQLYSLNLKPIKKISHQNAESLGHYNESNAK